MKKITTKSGIKGYECKLQESYTSLSEFEWYCDTYGLLTMLGFETAQEAWEANPTIQGSTSPEDFRIAPATAAPEPEKDGNIKCNKCGWIGYDEDLTLFETKGDEAETITAEETRGHGVTRHSERSANPDFFKGCPHCKTDAYLMDIEDTAAPIRREEQGDIKCWDCGKPTVGGICNCENVRREEEGFTPGEWKVVKSGEAWAVKEWAALANVQYGGGDSEFVILGNTPTHTLLKMEAEANAKLIASAPTLYRDNVRLQEENKELKEVLGLMQKVAEMYITNTEKHPDSKMTKESTITHYFKEANLKALLNRDK